MSVASDIVPAGSIVPSGPAASSGPAGRVDSDRPDAPLPPGIRFLARHGIPADALLAAAAVARRCDVPADVALIREGLADEEAVYRALAAEAGLPFLGDEAALHPLVRFPEAVEVGLAPLGPNESGLSYVFAPTGAQFARVAEARDLAPGFAVTTPTCLRRRVLAARAAKVAALAADGLPHASPHLSFRDGMSVGQFWGLMAAWFLLGAASAFDPEATWQVASVLLGLAFLLATIPRVAAPLEASLAPGIRRPRPRDAALPVYTVIVPLFREARVLAKLVRALAALDYPRSKLDIKIVVEEHDGETRGALADLALPPHMEVVVAPDGRPRTKPRALNVALKLARGEFTVVYDAEDVPEPDQLWLAVDLFRRSEPDVVCCQARLAIDNTRDGLLPAFFTLEYGALFDVLNPALIAYDLPITLGGTSNHLRTDVLRALGGWDAWNVTEDADLGLRLSAAGYRVADLPSTTWEEAPRRLGPWLLQRSRWMKGFLQVFVVHSRRPVASVRQIGLARYLAGLGLTVGAVASAAVFPFFLALSVADIAAGRWLTASRPGEVLSVAVGAILFVVGLGALTVPSAAAAVRRRWWGLLPLVPLMPAYFLLVSVATWRAFFELLLDPHRWNKTEHGLARTSRTGMR